MPRPSTPHRPGAQAPRRLTSAAQITAEIGPDAYLTYDVAPDELATAIAVDGAVSITRESARHGLSQVFFGTDEGIEDLVMWLLDDAAHIDVVPFQMAQLPQRSLTILRKHAVLGRGGTWSWLWTRDEPEHTPLEERVETIDPDRHRKAMTRFLKRNSPHALSLPADADTPTWYGIWDETGHVAAVTAAHRTPAGYLHLTSTAVAHDLRGRGFGRAVLAYVTRLGIRENGACTLGMSDSDDAAARLCVDLGYRLGHEWATYHLVAGKS